MNTLHLSCLHVDTILHSNFRSFEYVNVLLLAYYGDCNYITSTYQNATLIGFLPKGFCWSVLCQLRYDVHFTRVSSLMKQLGRGGILYSKETSMPDRLIPRRRLEREKDKDSKNKLF